MDDWQMIVLGLAILCAGILGYIMKTWRDLARLEGHLDSLREGIKLLREEGESLRVRLKKIETTEKESKT